MASCGRLVEFVNTGALLAWRASSAQDEMIDNRIVTVSGGLSVEGREFAVQDEAAYLHTKGICTLDGSCLPAK